MARFRFHPWRSMTGFTPGGTWPPSKPKRKKKVVKFLKVPA